MGKRNRQIFSSAVQRLEIKKEYDLMTKKA
jgi:hypothetical protein